MDADERGMVASALSGDEKSFEALIRRFSRQVYAVAYGVLQSREEAEDAVQDTFLKAYKMRGRLRDPEKVAGWLCMIARNRALDLLRKRRGKPELEEALEEIACGAAVEGDAAEEMQEQVRTVLAGLPEHHRTALTLRYLEGMDHRAIEETMGLTNGALRGVLGRALAGMRKGLAPMQGRAV